MQQRGNDSKPDFPVHFRFIHSGACVFRKLTFFVLLIPSAFLFGLPQENNTPPTPQPTPSSDQQASAAQEKASTTAKPGQKKEGDEDVPAARKPRQRETGASAPASPAPAKNEKKPADPLTSPDTYKGLALRNIGPAMVSGRIISLPVTPFNRAQYYVGLPS